MAILSSGFPSHPLRRSHLDSASYRTLVRILSCCLNESLVPRRDPAAIPNTQSSGAVKTPSIDLVADESTHPHPSIDPPRENSISIEELRQEKEILRQEDRESGHDKGREDRDRSVHGGSQEVVVFSNPTQERIVEGGLSSLEPSGNGQCDRSEDLQSDLLLFDSTEVVDSQDDVLSLIQELLDEEGQDDGENLNPKSRESMDGLKFGSSQVMEGDDEIVGNGEIHGSSMELHGREMRQGEYSQYLCSEAAKRVDFEGIPADKGQKKIIERTPQEIEEGEIPDEVQTLEDQEQKEGLEYKEFDNKINPDKTLATSSINSIHGHTGSRENNFSADGPNLLTSDEKDETASIRQESQDDRCLDPQSNSTCGREIEANDKCQVVVRDALESDADDSDDSEFQTKGESSHLKNVEGRKKKRLTEERKAKRKKAKKRKRAEKDREQGVKRLKLQSIVKPKVVKYCNYYLKGRCQQGDLCKFSHDTIPLTKSQPCKHFACGSCLKGDDCPYDHELSKYPCHNYMSKGMCVRGNRCKFSHKVSITEEFPTSISKSESQLSLEKQLKANTCGVVNGPPNKSTTSSTPFSIHKSLAGNLKCSKEPMRVPKGIRILSFGKGPPGGISNKQSKLVTEKSSSNNQEKMLTTGRQDALNLEHKSLLMSQSELDMMLGGAVRRTDTNVFASKESNGISFRSGPVTAPFSESLKTEVSDATKLLDEFLFGSGT